MNLPIYSSPGAADRALQDLVEAVGHLRDWNEGEETSLRAAGRYEAAHAARYRIRQLYRALGYLRAARCETTNGRPPV